MLYLAFTWVYVTLLYSADFYSGFCDVAVRGCYTGVYKVAVPFLCTGFCNVAVLDSYTWLYSVRVCTITVEFASAALQYSAAAALQHRNLASVPLLDLVSAT